MENQANNKKKTQIVLLIERFFHMKGVTEPVPSIVFSRYTRVAKQIIELCDGDLQRGVDILGKLKAWAEERNLEWGLDTVVKRWMELSKIPKPVSQSSCKRCLQEGKSMVRDGNMDLICLDCI